MDDPWDLLVVPPPLPSSPLTDWRYDPTEMLVADTAQDIADLITRRLSS